MSSVDELYAALGPDLHATAAPLFEFAQEQVRKRGAFLPVGATLETGGRVGLLTAISERHPATSEDVLPLLLEGLARAVATMDASIVAIAAVEWVRISGAGQTEQPAIKVRVHHRRGLAVTFYVPAFRSALGSWTFGDAMARTGDALLTSWPTRTELKLP